MSGDFPILSVSCGDPAGIGLEALMKALADGFLDADAALILHAVPELPTAQPTPPCAPSWSRGRTLGRAAAMGCSL